MSQIVHVVSMLEVMIKLGEMVFQSSEVMGAVCSGDLEFESKANGESFATDAPLALADLVIELEFCNGGLAGSDHNRK